MEKARSVLVLPTHRVYPFWYSCESHTCSRECDRDPIHRHRATIVSGLNARSLDDVPEAITNDEAPRQLKAQGGACMTCDIRVRIVEALVVSGLLAAICASQAVGAEKIKITVPVPST